MMNIEIVVRSGTGSLFPFRDSSDYYDVVFNDELDKVIRSPRQHSGWQSVRYGRKRYQLFGGIHTPYFICLNSPIGKCPKPSEQEKNNV